MIQQFQQMLESEELFCVSREEASAVQKSWK